MELAADNIKDTDIHVLFVDDEEFLVRMWKLSLERHGCRVWAYTDCLDALELFEKNPSAFDIVITDQTMAKMTGVDFAARLLKIRSDIPIILCTGYSEQVSEETAKRMGIREFLMKPFDIHQLGDIINSLITANKSI